MKKMNVLWMVAAIGLGLLVPAHLSAQGAYFSTMVGTVRDPTGAVIPGAQVTAMEVGTGVETSVVANATGDFRFEQLRPGNYSVKVVMGGFDTKTITGITLYVSQTERVDVVLEVGRTQQVVAVTGAAPLMQTESAEVQSVVKGNEVVDLPLLSRNVMSLSYLSTGAIATAGYRGEPTVYANGQTPYSNQVYVDGGSVTTSFVANAIERIPIDSIEEFKVETSNYAADVGMRAGAQITIATKHGTNNFHGDVFEFVQNDKFNAANVFATSLKKAPVRYNDFGGTVGGPIVKNKLFFFGNLEFVRNIAPATFRTEVPTASELEGNFTPGTGDRSAPVYNPNNVDPVSGLRQPFVAGNPYMVPQSMWSPVAVNYINAGLWPKPNLSGTPNYTYNGSGYNNFNHEAVRIDYNKSEKDLIYGRFGYQNNPYYAPGATAAPGMATGGNLVHGSDFVISWTHLFDPTKMNQVRFTLDDQNWAHFFQGQFNGKNESQTLGFNNASLVPQAFLGCPVAAFSGVSTTSACAGTSIQTQPNFNILIADDFTLTKGAHTIKTGVFLSRYRLNYAYSNPGGVAQTFTGAYTAQYGDLSGATGQPFADFLLGYLPAETIYQTGDVGENRRNFYQMYVMDTWKVNPKLTLQMGFRYEINRPEYAGDGRATGYFAGLQSRTGQVEVFPANSQAPLDAALAGNSGVFGFPYIFANDSYQYQPDDRDAGPRIGFAYRPFANSRHVIRGGFGIYYDTLNEVVAENSNSGQPFTLKASTPPLTTPAQESTPAYALGQVPVLNAWLNPGVVYNPTFAGSPQQPDGRVDQWNATYQVDLGHDIALTAGYLGNRNYHEVDFYTWNRTYFPGYTFNYADGTNFTITNSTPLNLRVKYPQIGSGAYAWPRDFGRYDSFQVTIEKRMSHGLQFRSGYTRSSSFGYQGSAGQQATVFQDEWATAFEARRNNDVPNIFYTSYVWQLPGFALRGWKNAVLGGWQNAGIITKNTGIPQEPKEGFPQWAGASNVLPVVTCNPNLSPSKRTTAAWFNTSCFSQPGVNQLGSNSDINIIRDDGAANLDTTLSKYFKITEQQRLQIRAEFFNAFNHPLFGAPGLTRGTSTFGVVTSAGAPRAIEFAVKYEF